MDWPAAHSMDTTWFAVDSRGRVALLESGEQGEVPYDWRGDQDGGEQLIERLLALGLPFHLEPYASVPPQRGIERFEGGAPSEWSLGYQLLIRTSNPRIRDLMPKALLLPGAAQTFLYVPYLADRRLLDRLFAHDLVDRVWCDASLAPLLGIYTFACGGGAYYRQTVPAHALALSEIPAPLGALAVPLSASDFSTDTWVAPSDSLPCYTRSA